MKNSTNTLRHRVTSQKNEKPNRHEKSEGHRKLRIMFWTKANLQKIAQLLESAQLSIDEICTLTLDHISFNNKARREIYIPNKNLNPQCGRVHTLSAKAYRQLQTLLKARLSTKHSQHPLSPLLPQASGKPCHPHDLLERLQRITLRPTA